MPPAFFSQAKQRSNNRQRYCAHDWTRQCNLRAFVFQSIWCSRTWTRCPVLKSSSKTERMPPKFGARLFRSINRPTPTLCSTWSSINSTSRSCAADCFGSVFQLLRHHNSKSSIFQCAFPRREQSLACLRRHCSGPIHLAKAPFCAGSISLRT